MKVKFSLLILICAGLMAALLSCEKKEEGNPPTVEITPSQITENSIQCVMTTTDAEQAAWICVGKGESVTAEQVLTNGRNVETNLTIELVWEDLQANTEYEIYAAAQNVFGTILSEPLQMRTLEENTPAVSVTLGVISENSVSFAINSYNAEEVKWEIAPKGSELCAEDVLENGTAVEPNTTVQCKAENLESLTEYVLFAAAKGGEKTVLSEMVEFTTLEEATFIELPSAVYASMTLVTGESEDTDKYTFMITNESGSFILQYDLHTEIGLNGNIPRKEYPIGEKGAGVIDVESINLFLDGQEVSISGGELLINLYRSDNSESGWKAQLEGFLESMAGTLPYFLSYNGAIDRFGIKSEEGGDTVFANVLEAWHTRPTEDDGVTPLFGQYSIFFRCEDSQGSSLFVTLAVNSKNNKHICSGVYLVGRSDESLGGQGLWINSEMSSVEMGVPPIPEQLEAGNGIDFYVIIETDMDENPNSPDYRDNYSIEFQIKTKGIYSASKTIKGTYYGPLGFNTGEDQFELYDLYYNYFTATPDGDNLKLGFTTSASQYSSLDLNIATSALPTTQSEQWSWYDINGGTIYDVYLGQGAVAENTGKLGIRYLGEYYDSFEDKTYPEYIFKTDGIIITLANKQYTSQNEWRANLMN